LPKDFKDKYRSSTTDTEELMEDIFKSAALHRELLIKYHPDLILDLEKKQMADELCKEINKNRRNYKRLKELKAECELKLF
jgi:2-oxo-4-hydroxy-4-carboxy--5-ureidoimidazoline (OHCU) decarboxylase